MSPNVDVWGYYMGVARLAESRLKHLAKSQGTQWWRTAPCDKTVGFWDALLGCVSPKERRLLNDTGEAQRDDDKVSTLTRNCRRSVPCEGPLDPVEGAA